MKDPAWVRLYLLMPPTRPVILRVTMLLFLCVHHNIKSQTSTYPLNRDFNIIYENALNDKASTFHSSIKPYVISVLKEISGKDSSINFKNILLSKIFPATINYHNSSFAVSPLLSFQPGYDLKDKKNILETSIGVRINGDLGNKFSFELRILSGNSNFTNYVDNEIKTTKVIPGIGYAYASKLGYSYQNISGYLSYSPNKIFNFQLGKDKNFWGDGYRSLLLSDVANSYPYFKISTQIWKIKYVNLFAAFKDITNPSGLSGDFKNKFGSFHYLSWNANKRLNLCFFESIIWQGTDSIRNRGYDINYLNPVIFYRPVEYSLGSSDNALLGVGFKLKVFTKQQFYGQAILDEFLLKEFTADLKHLLKPNDPTIISGWWGNKYGVQLGFKSFDIFHIKNLNLQTEINYVRPYTYSHASIQQNYGHYNQVLAHPLGANFKESVSFLNYRFKNWMIENKILFANYGADFGGNNFGKNIFKSYVTRFNEYGSFVGQGLSTNIILNDFHIAYILNPAINLKIEAGILTRLSNTKIERNQNALIYIAIRTALYNGYNDF